MFKSLPVPFRIGAIALFLKRKKAMAILVSLSFVRLAYNAYIGTVLLAGWIEYIAAIIILYFIYLCILKMLQ